jgi:hypothetical protein
VQAVPIAAAIAELAYAGVAAGVGVAFGIYTVYKGSNGIADGKKAEDELAKGGISNLIAVFKDHQALINDIMQVTAESR